MPDLIILVTNPTSLDLPGSLLGWIGWLLFLGFIILLNHRWRSLNQLLDTWHKKAFVFLSLSVPLTTLLLPSLQLPTQSPGTSLPIFTAVSWFIAAGLLGPGYAAILGFLSGLLITVWGDHSISLVLEMAFLGTWLGWMFYQEYRTPFFRGLRHPILAAFLLVLIYPIIHLIGIFILGAGSLIVRLDYGLNQILSATTAFGLVILVAGITGEIIARNLRSKWGSKRSTLPSPGETRLTSRFLFSVVPLSIVLLLILIIGTWFMAGRAARQMLEGRMSNAGEMTALSIPFFLETGQNLLLSLANEPIFDQSNEQIRERLASQRRDTLYFSQLIYLDPEGNLIASDPEIVSGTLGLTQGEIDRIHSAAIIPFDDVSIDPEPGGTTASRSFIAGVNNKDGELRGVLVGRSNLSVTPFARPLLTSVGSLSDIDGQGMIIDEDGLILYHPDSSQLMTQYTGKTESEPGFFVGTTPEDESEFVYFHPIEGKSWSVIITVPGGYAQQQAVNIALPLLGIITILSIAAIFIFRFGLNSVTSSLHELSVQADRMSQGDLDDQLMAGGEDEVGQLRRAFEKMRASLKSRLDELSLLLFVSQGIASTFDLEESLRPVLESALVTGASSARVYLVPSLIPNSSGSEASAYRLGSGPETEQYSFMDEQVSGLAEKRDILKLNNITRPRIFSYPENSTPPQAILAVAIRHENQFYGTLWIAYDQPHQFLDEEVRYIATLAGQAALAAANARLFLTTEIGRQRLESILKSTPDPVLVTDQNDNLMLANPAAQQTFRIYDESYYGMHISDVIVQDEVLDLLQSQENLQQSKELEFENGKTYFATASPVEVEGEGVGRVCVLRDVTSFKQLDASKTEFVSTVSHDLRSPLALIQGYSSMLQMVGDLSDQQTSYLKKIMIETEKISHLVTNLLDLGRIEAGIGLHLEKKPADDVIRKVISTSKVQADQKRVRISPDIPQKDLPYINADQDLLLQALYNLVDNAIKFTDPGGEISIGVNTNNESVVYKVEDSGIGISPADQQKLFEKFFRISSKGGPEEGGSGLGLAIVKSIAERHGGQVRVESQLGIGSTFFLEIPLEQK
jgi:PAS domain S-box-containing protein